MGRNGIHKPRQVKPLNWQPNISPDVIIPFLPGLHKHQLHLYPFFPSNSTASDLQLSKSGKDKQKLRESSKQPLCWVMLLPSN